MNARINSIYLVYTDKGLYWKITFQDEHGNVIGTFGDENHCSDIDFRNQTFYLMKILNNWDLLKLDGQKKSFPILVDNEFYRINCIANTNGEYLKFDYATGEVLSGVGCDVSQFCKREISSLISQSGALFAEITDKFSRRAVSGDLAYLGFSPIYAGQATETQEQYGARCFKNFVCGMLKLCGVRELVQSNSYPEISLKYDSNGNVIAIGNIEGNEYLYITETGYELINEKQKRR